MAPLADLEKAWRDAQNDSEFHAELSSLLKNYAGRPTSLYLCSRLSKHLDLDLWLKREDLLHTGAHKINNTLGQALLARRMGKTRVIAETGAGQHGVATATAAALLGLDCVVYMGAVDAARQQPNVQRMKLLGATVELVHSGQKTLKDAVNEALRSWVEDPIDTHYILGSVLGPHPFPSMVASFHEVIGQEARAQILDQSGALPDLAVACVGGGSNAIGLFRAFIPDDTVRLVGVEAGGTGLGPGEHAARFAGGSPGVLHGTYTWMLQDEAGQVQPTHSISAGLDYPAVGPEHAMLRDQGRAEYVHAGDESALAACKALAEYEGILGALESCHALAWVMDNRGDLQGKTVLVNLSGRGDKDLAQILDRLGIVDDA
jgi:tryptophan synthase beta chain